MYSLPLQSRFSHLALGMPGQASSEPPWRVHLAENILTASRCGYMLDSEGYHVDGTEERCRFGAAHNSCQTV
jgi:hypothetical protein